MSNLTIAPLIGKVATEKRNLDPLADRLFFFNMTMTISPIFWGGLTLTFKKRLMKLPWHLKLKRDTP